jgi:hypothetical protein
VGFWCFSGDGVSFDLWAGITIFEVRGSSYALLREFFSARFRGRENAKRTHRTRLSRAKVAVAADAVTAKVYTNM